MLLVLRWPEGLIQVTEIVVPGRYFDTTLVRSSGEPMACPLTAVMTDPAVMPAPVAGPPQMTPRIRVPELTGAMVVGAGMPPASLV